ncbi:MAG: hypothetical protein HYT87_04080 [Nitrospirae bacterium]|nr:hypothetical protein [Nitrospirota bacterium]
MTDWRASPYRKRVPGAVAGAGVVGGTEGGGLTRRAARLGEGECRGVERVDRRTAGWGLVDDALDTERFAMESSCSVRGRSRRFARIPGEGDCSGMASFFKGGGVLSNARRSSGGIGE